MIHVAVVPEHLAEWPAAGVFFILLTAAEVGVAALLFTRVRQQAVLLAAVASVDRPTAGVAVLPHGRPAVRTRSRHTRGDRPARHRGLHARGRDAARCRCPAPSGRPDATPGYVSKCQGACPRGRRRRHGNRARGNRDTVQRPRKLAWCGDGRAQVGARVIDLASTTVMSVRGPVRADERSLDEASWMVVAGRSAGLRGRCASRCGHAARVGGRGSAPAEFGDCVECNPAVRVQHRAWVGADGRRIVEHGGGVPGRGAHGQRAVSPGRDHPVHNCGER